MRQESNKYFENLVNEKKANYVSEFENRAKKARNLNTLIWDHERQIQADNAPIGGSSNVNPYIGDVLFHFYHMHDLGDNMGVILEKIHELRTTHLKEQQKEPSRYERTQMRFNLNISDDTAILDFLSEHYAKKEFMQYLKELTNSDNANKVTALGIPTEVSRSSGPKIKWNGKQNQLAELIIELTDKGWFGSIAQGDLHAICVKLTELFELPQNKSDSNPTKSLYQILKGEVDSITKSRTYPKVQSRSDKKSFSHIKPRK